MRAWNEATMREEEEEEQQQQKTLAINSSFGVLHIAALQKYLISFALYFSDSVKLSICQKNVPTLKLPLFDKNEMSASYRGVFPKVSIVLSQITHPFDERKKALNLQRDERR